MFTNESKLPIFERIKYLLGIGAKVYVNPTNYVVLKLDKSSPNFRDEVKKSIELIINVHKQSPPITKITLNCTKKDTGSFNHKRKFFESDREIEEEKLKQFCNECFYGKKN